eukprot:2368736-Rhodomonas_salina.2
MARWSSEVYMMSKTKPSSCTTKTTENVPKLEVNAEGAACPTADRRQCVSKRLRLFLPALRSAYLQVLGGAVRLLHATLGQRHVNPTGEAVLLVPLRLSVAHKHQRVVSILIQTSAVAAARKAQGSKSKWR